jgi:hypothetical protein
LTVELALKGTASLEWMGSTGSMTVTTGEPAQHQFELPPFELCAASAAGDLEVVDFRARFPASSLGVMQREIQDLKAKLAATDPGDAKSVLENPSLEAVTGQGGIPGWIVPSESNSQATLDATHPYDGATALLLRCNGPMVSVRSNAFALPRTGRLSISAWLRSDTGPVPPVRFLVEAASDEQLVYRFSQVAQPASAPISGAWIPYVIHVDDLPIDARQLRIGFDLESVGSVWIDRVEIRDRWLDPAEVQSLKQLLNLANYKLQEQGDAVGCLRILESYWPRFIDDQFSDSAARLESAALPSTDGAPPTQLK